MGIGDPPGDNPSPTPEQIAIAERLLNIGRETTRDLQTRLETLNKVINREGEYSALIKDEYADRQRTKLLRETELQLEGQLLDEMRKRILAGADYQDLLEGMSPEQKAHYQQLADNLQLLDGQLNSVEAIRDAHQRINTQLAEGTPLQTKMMKAAADWGAAMEQGARATASLAWGKSLAGMEVAIKKITRVGVDLIMQFDQQTKAFERQLQLGPRYTQAIKANYKALNEYGVSIEDATKAETSLVKAVTDYTMMSGAEQQALRTSGALAAELGVNIEDYAKGVQNSMKMFDLSVGDAIAVQGELAATARMLGRDQGEFAAEFAASGQALAKFGDQGVKAFKDLQHIAKITGMEMNKLLSITNKFDTFEGAAEQAGKLNAALGGNFVNAMDLMMTTDPAERFSMIRDSILDAGLSFDDMSYYQKNFYKDALGLADVGDLALMLSGNMDDLAGSSNQSAEALIEQKERAQAVMNIQDKLKAILADNADGFLKLAETVQKFVSFLQYISPVLRLLFPFMVALRVATMVQATANIFLASSNQMVAAGAKKAQIPLMLFASALSAIAAGMLMKSPSLLVIALFAMAGALFALSRVSDTSAASIQKLAIPMMQLGAAIFLATAGVALMAAAFSLLSVEQMAGMAVVLLAIGVGLYFLTPALIAAGGAAMGVAPGLLILAAVFLAIGAGIGMAAAGIGLMGTGMAMLFEAIDVPKAGALLALFIGLGVMAPLLLLASVGVGYLAVAFAGLALSMALMSTEKVAAFGEFISSLGGLTDIANLAAVRSEIEGIIETIGKLDTHKTLTFTSNLEALADVEKLSAATNRRAAAGTSATVEKMAMIINGTQGTAAPAGAETIERVRQPVTLKVDGDEMANFVIEVVGKRVKELNLHNG